MLDAIRSATALHQHGALHLSARNGRRSIHFRARSERARHGVNVTIVVDAIGSFSLGPPSPAPAAGCRIESYQRFQWHSLARVNNRTHRELLIVDGRIAFVGGAGIAEIGGRWRGGKSAGRGATRWPGLRGLSWRRSSASRPRTGWCCGEILTGPEYFPNLEEVGNTTAFVVRSSPADRATASRVSFQLLMEGADRDCGSTRRIFCPIALQRALIDLAERGVEVSIIVPGPATDQRWVRYASRRLWGRLLEAESESTNTGAR